MELVRGKAAASLILRHWYCVTNTASLIKRICVTDFSVSKGLIFIAGQAPVLDGKHQSVGKVGAEVTLEAAQAAARLCGLNVLAQVKAAVGGDWPRVTRCVRICGYVSSAPGFYDQPKVLDGASDLMVQALGDAGKHARSALGVGRCAETCRW